MESHVKSTPREEVCERDIFIFTFKLCFITVNVS